MFFQVLVVHALRYWVVFYYLHMSQFIYSPVDGVLNCLESIYLTSMIKLLWNVCTSFITFSVLVFLFILSKYLGMGWLCYRVNICLCLQKPGKTISKVVG